MSNEERDALAVALAKTIRISVALATAAALLIGLATNYFQNQAIDRRIDEIERLLQQRPSTNTNSVIIGNDKAKLIEEIAKERFNAGLQ